MFPLKQSTSVTVPFFVHDSSGNAVTGLVDGGFTKRISKGSGAWAAMTVTITEMENGWYSFPLSALHSNTLGVLSITFTHASAQQVNLQYRVHAKLPDDIGYTVDLIAGESFIYVWSDPNQGDDANDGTFGSPVLTEGAAYTLAAAQGIRGYHIRGGLALGRDYENWTFRGGNKAARGTVLLNGYDCDACTFENAVIVGEGDTDATGISIPGNRVTAVNCELDDVANIHGYFHGCGIISRFRSYVAEDGPFKAAAQDYILDECYAQIPAGSTNIYGAIETYPEGFYGTSFSLNDTGINDAVAQSFTGNGETLAVARFFLSTDNYDAPNPVPGTLQAHLYAHTGTYGTSSIPTGAPIESSATVAASDIVEAVYNMTDFTFANTTTLVNGTKYCIVLTISGADSGLLSWVNVGGDNAVAVHGGNSSRLPNGGAWTAVADTDLCFYIGTRISTTGNAVIDFGSATLDHDVQLHGFTGPVEVQNMSTGRLYASLHGGALTATASATGGTITVDGFGEVTDAGGGATVTDNTVGGARQKLIEQILRNKLITDPSTGVMTLYDNDGNSLLTANIFEDAAGAQAYRGRGAERRERLT